MPQAIPHGVRFLQRITTLLVTACLSTGTTADERPKCDMAATVVDPFCVQPFVVPAELAEIDRYRKGWHRLSGFEYSGLHWNQFIILYVNQAPGIYRHNYNRYLDEFAEDDWGDEEDESPARSGFRFYPPGTIFIKENFRVSEGRPAAAVSLTVMKKHQPGYDPERGDWEFIQSDVDGRILNRGKASDPGIRAICSDCHANIADRDYIFSTFYSAPR